MSGADRGNRMPRPKFMPDNELERLLVAAVNEAGKRPGFYRELIDSPLLIIGSTNREGYGSFEAGENTRLSIRQWQDAGGRPVIPAFTSLPRLYEAIEGQENYVQVQARDLFGMLGPGLRVVLNPRSEFGKMLSSEEIAALLDGSIFSPVEHHVVEEEQRLLLGQPAEYPQKLVDALKSLFVEHPEVEKAYLAQIYNPASGEPPHPLVGIQARGDIARLASEAGTVASQVLGEGVLVDFVKVGSDSLSEYLTGETEPFYTVEGD